MRDTHQLESRMRETRQSGSAGGAEQINAPSLPLSDDGMAPLILPLYDKI
jgi:hypothetical protein